MVAQNDMKNKPFLSRQCLECIMIFSSKSISCGSSICPKRAILILNRKFFISLFGNIKPPYAFQIKCSPTLAVVGNAGSNARQE
jgi:hypothetical protein